MAAHAPNIQDIEAYHQAKSTMQTVVVAVDGSNQAERALQYYLDNLHKGESRVVLLHCIEPLNTETDSSAEMYNSMIQQKEQKVKDLEDKYTAKLTSRNVEGSMLTMMSYKPGEVIVEQARKENATMVVMGTRGLGTIRRTLIGSVSDYVVHHAHCAVVICMQ